MLLICTYVILFIYIVGCNGDIIPNKDTRNAVILDRHGKEYDVTDIVQKAVASAYESSIHVKQKDPTVQDVAATQQLLRSAIMHSLRLFDLKQVLSKEDKKYGGVKFHSLWYHWGFNVIMLCSANFSDLALFEHAHIKDGIHTFNRTCKRKVSQTKEMMQTIVNRNVIQSMKQARGQEKAVVVVMYSLICR
jgi:hypothetical protein